MREINIEGLKVGEVLGSTIYCNYSYKILLPRGTIITEEHIKQIKRFDGELSCMVLEPSDTDGIRLDVLSQFDEQVQKAYLDTFITSKSIFNNISCGNPINFKLANETVDVIIKEIVSSSNLLLQLSAIKIIDDYTLSHMVNVAVYAGSMAKYLNFSTEDIRDITLAGLLHDAGKAKLPIDILVKPDKLTENEYEIIKKHSEYGYLELKKVVELSERVRQVALQHHERGDGSGYPNGLKQKEISLFARIIAIVDVYDALTSDRCYRKRVLPHESVEVIMGDCAFGKLDVELVKIFLRNIALYPLGSEVVLNNGKNARVVHINPHFPLRPVLDILECGAEGKVLVSGTIDLLNEPTVFITKVNN